jgi:hypothetical protein
MEEINKKTIKIARTRTGVPCLWESLMTFTDLKRSTVVLDSKGKPKSAVYLNETREKQALVPIVVGDYIAKSFEDKNGVAISVFKIEEINAMKNEAVINPVYRKSSLVSDYTVPNEYTNMVDYSMQKLQDTIKVVSYLKEKEIA